MKDFGNSKENIRTEIKQGVSEFEKENSKEEKLFSQLSLLVSSYENPEDFFSVGEYKLLNEFEKIINELSLLAYEKIMGGHFSEAGSIGRRVLEISGIASAKDISVESPNGVIALAEAINWGAKTLSCSFYSLKPLMIAVATKTEGVIWGYGEDGAYYLSTPTIGVASFHDPNDEVGYLITNCLKQEIPVWEYGWSQVTRQDDAFRILEDLSSGEGLIKIYSDATLPDEMKKARDLYMKNNIHSRLVTIGNLIKEKINIK